MLINGKTISLNEESKQLNWKQFSKAFLNASSNGIVVTDLSFKTAISNKKAQECLDVFTGTLIPATLPELTEQSTTALRNTKTIRHIQISRQDKKFMTRISPILWNKSTLGLLYLFEDVTTLER